MASRYLEITIDHLPSATLSPNARVVWPVRYSANKIARLEAGWLAKSKWRDQAPMLYAVITYTFSVTVQRRRDEDNFVARCKPWQDGLVDAGVLINDDMDHLKLGGVSIIRGSKKYTRITLTEYAEKLDIYQVNNSDRTFIVKKDLKSDT